MADRRTRLRRAIFASCRSLGLDTDDRHALQLEVTGRVSLTAMTDEEMEYLLQALKGGRPALRPARGILPSGSWAGKLRALWISAYWLGVTRDASDEALAAWIVRQTGYGCAKWAAPKDAGRLIDALRDWMARDAGVDWSPYRHAGGTGHRPAARVLEALWRRMLAAGLVQGDLRTRVQGDPVRMSASEQNRLIRELGEELRAAGK